VQKQRIAPAAWLGVGLVLVAVIPQLIPECPFIVRVTVAAVAGIIAVACFVGAARAYWWNQGFEACKEQIADSKDAFTQNPSALEPKRAPGLTALEPQVTFVSEMADGGYAEQPTADAFCGALIAPFHHDPTTPPAQVVRANISYYDAEGVHQRVNYGSWLGQEVNWAEFDASDTRSLVLAIGSGKQFCIAVDDNRDDASKSKGTTPRALTSDELSATVELVVMDENFSFVAAQKFRYKLNLPEFKVSKA